MNLILFCVFLTFSVGLLSAAFRTFAPADFKDQQGNDGYRQGK